MGDMMPPRTMKTRWSSRALFGSLFSCIMELWEGHTRHKLLRLNEFQMYIYPILSPRQLQNILPPNTINMRRSDCKDTDKLFRRKCLY